MILDEEQLVQFERYIYNIFYHVVSEEIDRDIISQICAQYETLDKTAEVTTSIGGLVKTVKTTIE